MHFAIDQRGAHDAFDGLAQHPGGGPRVAVPDHAAGVELGEIVGALFVGLTTVDLDLFGCGVRDGGDLEPEPRGGIAVLLRGLGVTGRGKLF